MSITVATRRSVIDLITVIACKTIVCEPDNDSHSYVMQRERAADPDVDGGGKEAVGVLLFVANVATDACCLNLLPSLCAELRMSQSKAKKVFVGQFRILRINNI